MSYQEFYPTGEPEDEELWPDGFVAVAEKSGGFQDQWKDAVDERYRATVANEDEKDDSSANEPVRTEGHYDSETDRIMVQDQELMVDPSDPDLGYFLKEKFQSGFEGVAYTTIFTMTDGSEHQASYEISGLNLYITSELIREAQELQELAAEEDEENQNTEQEAETETLFSFEPREIDGSMDDGGVDANLKSETESWDFFGTILEQEQAIADEPVLDEALAIEQQPATIESAWTNLFADQAPELADEQNDSEQKKVETSSSNVLWFKVDSGVRQRVTIKTESIAKTPEPGKDESDHELSESLEFNPPSETEEESVLPPAKNSEAKLELDPTTTKNHDKEKDGKGISLRKGEQEDRLDVKKPDQNIITEGFTPKSVFKKDLGQQNVPKPDKNHLEITGSSKTEQFNIPRELELKSVPDKAVPPAIKLAKQSSLKRPSSVELPLRPEPEETSLEVKPQIKLVDNSKKDNDVSPERLSAISPQPAYFAEAGPSPESVNTSAEPAQEQKQPGSETVLELPQAETRYETAPEPITEFAGEKPAVETEIQEPVDTREVISLTKIIANKQSAERYASPANISEEPTEKIADTLEVQSIVDSKIEPVKSVDAIEPNRQDEPAKEIFPDKAKVLSETAPAAKVIEFKQKQVEAVKNKFAVQEHRKAELAKKIVSPIRLVQRNGASLKKYKPRPAEARKTKIPEAYTLKRKFDKVIYKGPRIENTGGIVLRSRISTVNSDEKERLLARDRIARIPQFRVRRRIPSQAAIKIAA